MDIETIRIGNEDESSLIVLFDLEFDKFQFIPNLNQIINEYFLEDINYIYLTNQIELEKGDSGRVLFFTKDNI